MEANVDRREDWQKDTVVQFSYVRGEPVVKLACACRRTLVEDFENGRFVCPRCGNQITIADAGEKLYQFVGKAEELLDALSDAMRTPAEEDEEKPAKRATKKKPTERPPIEPTGTAARDG